MKHWIHIISEYAKRGDDEWLSFQFAYLRKSIGSYLRKCKLSPVYSRLKNWHVELDLIKTEFSKLESTFPKTLKGWEGHPPKAVYEYLLQSEAKVNSAIGKVVSELYEINSDLFSEARSLKEWGLSVMEIEHIGLEPSYRNEGYILLPKKTDFMGCFRYEISTLLNSNAKEFIRFHPLTEIQTRVFSGASDVRKQVLKNHSGKNIPAIYRISTTTDLPYWHTLRPLAKRKLLEHVRTY